MRTDRFVLVWISVSLCIYSPSAHASQTQPSTQTGYIRVVPDNGTTSPDGVAILGLQSGGTLITEAAVPTTPTIRSGRIFVEIGGVINTGIALANPNNEDATVSYYFTDSSGNDFGGGIFTLLANHQIATYLTDQPFGLTSLVTGTFTFSSSAPVAAVALRSLVNERSEALITTVPVSVPSSGFGGTALLIPRFADGCGWTTKVVLVNPGNTSLSGTVRFFGQGSKNGYTQLTNVSANGVTASTFSYTVPPRSAFRLVAQPASTSTQVGSVRITPAGSGGAPSSVAIYSCRKAGITVFESSVAALPTARAFRLYIESAGVFGQIGSMQTGINISNPTGKRITVQMNVAKLDGTSAGLTASVSVPAGGQVFKFGSELFSLLPSTFKGVVTITAPSDFVVAGLRGRYNERTDLLMTTTPPHNDASVPSLETVFPHFVSGAGFSTQLILLSTGPAHTGSLSILSQDGSALPNTNLNPNP